MWRRYPQMDIITQLHVCKSKIIVKTMTWWKAVYSLSFDLCLYPFFFSKPLYSNFFLVCLFYNTHTGEDSNPFGDLLMALDSGKAEVRRDKISKMVGFDRFRINNLLDDKYKPRERYSIVRDACRMVGQELPYSIATHNCEHFVTELRYGKPESRQVGILWVLYYCLNDYLTCKLWYFVG